MRQIGHLIMSLVGEDSAIDLIVSHVSCPVPSEHLSSPVDSASAHGASAMASSADCVGEARPLGDVHAVDGVDEDRIDHLSIGIGGNDHAELHNMQCHLSDMSTDKENGEVDALEAWYDEVPPSGFSAAGTTARCETGRATSSTAVASASSKAKSAGDTGSEFDKTRDMRVGRSHNRVQQKRTVRVGHVRRMQDPHNMAASGHSDVPSIRSRAGSESTRRAVAQASSFVMKTAGVAGMYLVSLFIMLSVTFLSDYAHLVSILNPCVLQSMCH